MYYFTLTLWKLLLLGENVNGYQYRYVHFITMDYFTQKLITLSEVLI